MRCPSCHAVNPRDAERCANCGKAFPRKPARKRAESEESDADAAARAEESNRAALRAYRLSLFGLIPFAGLVLGPAALVLGVAAGRKGRRDPAFTAHGPAAAAVVLGAVDALTNWAGVVLMVLGLLSMFAW